jgi:hypothetical protein
MIKRVGLLVYKEMLKIQTRVDSNQNQASGTNHLDWHSMPFSKRWKIKMSHIDYIKVRRFLLKFCKLLLEISLEDLIRILIIGQQLFFVFFFWGGGGGGRAGVILYIYKIGVAFVTYVNFR